MAGVFSLFDQTHGNIGFGLSTKDADLSANLNMATLSFNDEQGKVLQTVTLRLRRQHAAAP